MKKPATLGEMVFHIHSMNSEVSDEIYAHLQTLQGPRTRGSNTKYGLQELYQQWGEFQLLPANEDDTKSVGNGCTAYYLELSSDQQQWLDSKMNCVTLENYDEDSDTIICRKGKHGWELVLEIPCPIDIPEYRIYFIWSDTDNCLATWHPGKPLRMLPQDCAVKLR